MTALAWLIAIPVAIYALLFWLCLLIAAGFAAAAAARRMRPRLEARRGLRDFERDLAERRES